MPTAVDEENQRACNNHFRLLSNKQQKNMVLAFDYGIKTGSIRNPAGYFINLTRSAKDNSLCAIWREREDVK